MYTGGRSIKKIGILIVLLLAGIIFVSGCAEETQKEETGAEEGTPVEEAAVTEGAEEPSGEDAGDEIPEEETPLEGQEGIIPAEEENQTAIDNQTVVDSTEADSTEAA